MVRLKKKENHLLSHLDALAMENPAAGRRSFRAILPAKQPRLPAARPLRVRSPTSGATSCPPQGLQNRWGGKNHPPPTTVNGLPLVNR
jgi:hypothetical protein